MTAETPTKFAQWRDGFAAARELMVICAVLLLLIAPSVVRGSLERAGIRSVAGVEFDAREVAEIQGDLDSALEEVTRIRQQLASANELIAKVREQGVENVIDPRLGSISRMLAQTEKEAEEAETSLQRSGRRNHALLQKSIQQGLLTPDYGARMPIAPPRTSVIPASVDPSSVQLGKSLGGKRPEQELPSASNRATATSELQLMLPDGWQR